MRELTSSELKEKLLEILAVVDTFCGENDIRYSLIGGTLLGAVRHKGFIPWDDDIDILMPRPDYDKFIASFEDDSHYYKIQCYEKDKNAFFPFAKVFDTRTKLFEHGLDTGLGINIDIFQIDGFDLHNNIYRIKFIFGIIKILMMVKKYGRHPERKNPIYRIISILLKPVPMWIFSTLFQRIMKKYDFNSSRYVCFFSGYNAEKEVFPRRIFDHYIDIRFEDHLFKSIRDYDICLSNNYGDYMKLPPIEEQTPKHESIGFIK
jgi:lipopolysaccharide cholinephosphotransferase